MLSGKNAVGGSSFGSFLRAEPKKRMSNLRLASRKKQRHAKEQAIIEMKSEE
jgi:hypothetical protein